MEETGLPVHRGRRSAHLRRARLRPGAREHGKAVRPSSRPISDPSSAARLGRPKAQAFGWPRARCTESRHASRFSVDPPAVLPPRPVAACAARVLRPAVARAAVRRHALPLSREHPPGRRRSCCIRAARGADAARRRSPRSAVTSLDKRALRRRKRRAAAAAPEQARHAHRRIPLLRARERAAARTARRCSERFHGGTRSLPRCCTPAATRSRRRSFVDKGEAGRASAPGQAVIDELGVVGPGDARVPVHGRGHARDRQGPGGAGEGRAQRHAQRAVRQPGPAVRPSCGSPRRTPTCGSATACSRRGSTAPIRPACPVAEVIDIERDTRADVRAHRAASRSPASTAASYVLVLGQVGRHGHAAASGRARRDRTPRKRTRRGRRRG